VLESLLRRNRDAQFVLLQLGLHDLMRSRLERTASLDQSMLQMQKDLDALVSLVETLAPNANIISNTYVLPNLLSNTRCASLASQLFDQPSVCPEMVTDDCINRVMAFMGHSMTLVPAHHPKYSIIESLCDFFDNKGMFNEEE
jgi:hypothetical protein